MAQYSAPSTASIQALQAKFCGIEYLVIDEKSMIGVQAMSWLDQACQSIYPKRSELLFGGLNIILAGDFFQLPPVTQQVLYCDEAGLKPGELLQGKQHYYTFSKMIELDTIMHQQGVDDTSVHFQQVLDNLWEDQL